jgi:hypothetical protein
MRWSQIATTFRDNKITLIFKYIKQIEEARQKKLDQKPRKQIGYKLPKKNKNSSD